MTLVSLGGSQEALLLVPSSLRLVAVWQVTPAAQEHLRAAASLLGVDSEGLSKALTTRTRQTVDGALAGLLGKAGAAHTFPW